MFKGLMLCFLMLLCSTQAVAQSGDIGKQDSVISGSQLSMRTFQSLTWNDIVFGIPKARFDNSMSIGFSVFMPLAIQQGSVPAVVMLAGPEGFSFDDGRQRSSTLYKDLFLQLGLAVIEVHSYESIGRNKLPVIEKTLAQASDAIRIKQVLESAKGIDPNRIILFGHAAGGQALINALDQRVEGRVKGVGGTSRPYLGAIAVAPGCNITPDPYRSSVPLLIIQPTDDMVSGDQNCKYFAQSNRSGSVVQIVPVEGANAGFDDNFPMSQTNTTSVAKCLLQLKDGPVVQSVDTTLGMTQILGGDESVSNYLQSCSYPIQAYYGRSSKHTNQALLAVFDATRKLLGMTGRR